MSKKPFKKPSFSGGPKALLIGIIIMFALLFALTQLTDYAKTLHEFTYKEFLDQVKSGHVQSIVVNGQQVDGVLKNNQRFQATVVQRDTDLICSKNMELITLLQRKALRLIFGISYYCYQFCHYCYCYVIYYL